MQETQSIGVSPTLKKQKTLDPDFIRVARHLCPNGKKLYDFREEEGFRDVSQQTISEARTLLPFNRLLTIWDSVANVSSSEGDVAEIGTYFGGSAKFIARSFAYCKEFPAIHVFDTFSGHPDTLSETIDGEHHVGRFSSETSEADVRTYLSDFSNITVYAGAIEDTSACIDSRKFKLVHVDVDIYTSTMFCLKFFSPRMVPGGVIVIDDYGFKTCQGVKHAVDYFLSIDNSFTFWYMHTGQVILVKRTSSVELKNVPTNNDSAEHLKGRLYEKEVELRYAQNRLVSLNATSQVENAQKQKMINDLRATNEELRATNEELSRHPILQVISAVRRRSP